MNLLKRLRLFTDDNRGSIPTEGVLAFTMLIWWYLASFQFFDAFRQKNINLKAAYTIADLISRQTDAIDQGYVNGLNTVFDYLTFSNRPTWVRISSIWFDTSTNSYKVGYSQVSDPSRPVRTDASINADAAKVPVLPPGESVILVETFMAYEPIFRIGLDARWYDTFIVTRPRFASCVPWDPQDGVTVPACTF